jgi:hypothetical protein
VVGQVGCAQMLKNVPSLKLGRLLSGMHPSIRGAFLKSMGKGMGGSPNVLRVRLPFTPTAINSTVTTGVLANLFGLQLTSISGIADWTPVFAQYRILRGNVTFSPQYQVVCTPGILPTAPYGAAGIEYDSDVSAPVSVAEVIQNENSKVITMGQTKVYNFPFDLEKAFGEVWNDTGVNQVFATWKIYCLGYGATAHNVGVIGGHAEVEFRGLA